MTEKRDTHYGLREKKYNYTRNMKYTFDIFIFEKPRQYEKLVI